MIVFVSHSTGCVGWDMEGIYKGTSFKSACRTLRFKGDIDKDIQMLDWDYRGWKKTPEKIEELHLRIIKDYEIRTVMSMDLWEYNIKQALEYANKLQKYTDRVLIPVHYYCKEILDYMLAYPNANWFTKNVFPPSEYRDNIRHILGGSPQAQIKHLTTRQTDIIDGSSLRFKNVESIDGNQLFNVAVRVGKEWFPNRPYWRKPKNESNNETIFRTSVKRFDFYLHYILACRDVLDLHINGVDILKERGLIE